MKKFLLILSFLFAYISLSKQCMRSTSRQAKNLNLWNRMCFELCNTDKGGLSYEGKCLKRLNMLFRPEAAKLMLSNANVKQC